MTSENTNPVITPTSTQVPEAVVPPPLPLAAAPVLPARRYAPGLAVVLSFFPGLGHLYLGLYQRGIGVFLAFAFGIFIADHSDFGVLVAFAWFFAVIDAYRQACALNAGLLPEPLSGMEIPKRGRHGSLGFGVFLTLIGLLLLYNQFYPLDLTFMIDWWPMLLVLAGVYLVVRHFLEQKRRQQAEEAMQ